MGLFQRYVRYRHGRGFGVHSPLGYELITAVLSDRPAYYADSVIKERIAGRRQRRIARIIVRLIARFEPRTVECHESFFGTVTLADSRIRCSALDDIGAEMKINRNDEGTVTVTLGPDREGWGPLILDNEKDLRIVIYRSGLSPTLIKTKL